MKVRIQVVAVLLLFLCVGIMAACSHSQPYFQPGTSFTIDPDNLLADSLSSRIILIGDAGEANAAALGAVDDWVERSPQNTLVIFLGDNMYPEGMTRRRRGEAEVRLLPQIQAAARHGARVLFVPGNHDWADGGDQGYEAILAQREYVDRHSPHEDAFLPTNGCPGPTAIDPFPSVRIVAIDTQWWLQAEVKPVEDCPDSDPQNFAASLARLIDTNRDVIIAGHHPLAGFGRHAGFSDWREHLLPPVGGTIVALWRKLWPRRQDFGSAPYRRMTELYRSALERPPRGTRIRVWAAGHEHSLQVLEPEAVDYLLISGSGAKTTPVGHGPETIFAHSRPGFMALDFLMSGKVMLRVIEPGQGEVYSMWLR